MLCTSCKQVLEVTEQLLCQSDLLLDMGRKELPADSYAGQFLTSLGAALAEQPQLGTVIRCVLRACTPMRAAVGAVAVLTVAPW